MFLVKDLNDIYSKEYLRQEVQTQLGAVEVFY